MPASQGGWTRRGRDPLEASGRQIGLVGSGGWFRAGGLPGGLGVGGAAGGEGALVGDEVDPAVGERHRQVSASGWRLAQPPSVFARWWVRSRGVRLSLLVAPPRWAAMVWSRSIDR